MKRGKKNKYENKNKKELAKRVKRKYKTPVNDNQEMIFKNSTNISR